jgi:hypothetical protein
MDMRTVAVAVRARGGRLDEQGLLIPAAGEARMGLSVKARGARERGLRLMWMLLD